MAHEASEPIGAPLTLRTLTETLAVARLEPGEAWPAWLPRHGFVSLTRTAFELSIVCDERAVPPDVRAERGYRALEVVGPLDFALTGVMASLAAPLARAGVSILAIATFDTDYVLVRAADLDRARHALGDAGHVLE